jgi:glycosyltransferase involved in cell wall biosynthesis
MKIAIVSCFYPYRGGIAQFNANLYAVLSREHTVKAFNFSRQYPSLLFPGKTQYVTDKDTALAIDSERVLDSANPFTYYSTAKKVVAFEPDVIILRYWHTYFAPSMGYIARYATKRGYKVITIADNIVPHETHWFDTFFTKWFLKQNTALVTLSEAVRDDLVRLHPTAKHMMKRHPLYNHFGEKMPAEQARQQLHMDSNKKTLLFFGLIRDYKGLDLLLNAMNLLDDSYQLVIAGECYGSFDSYQRQIDTNKNKQNIHLFQRYIDDSEVPMFFSAADVCVLPYKTATQSGIAAISYHFEVPLVITDTGGLKEMVETPHTGLVCESIDSESIARSIKQFFAEDKTTFIKGIQAERKALSWENFAQSLTEFIQSV